MDDFDKLKTSGEKVTADMIEIVRELKLEIEPKNITELMQSCDKTWKDDDLFLTDE